MDENVAESIGALATNLERITVQLRSIAHILQDRDESIARSAVRVSLLSIAEAAAQSGLSIWSIRRLIDTGQVEVRRIGRRVFISEQSLAEYVSGRG